MCILLQVLVMSVARYAWSRKLSYDIDTSYEISVIRIYVKKSECPILEAYQ